MGVAIRKGSKRKPIERNNSGKRISNRIWCRAPESGGDNGRRGVKQRRAMSTPGADEEELQTRLPTRPLFTELQKYRDRGATANVDHLHDSLAVSSVS